MALALALVFGSVVQTAPAQSQDQDFHYLVDTPDPIVYLCLGESRDILVRILASGSIGPGDSIDKATINLGADTTVSGLVADETVGTFTNSHFRAFNSPSPTLIRPALVAFTFKTKKAGDTTITFDADIIEFGYTFKAQPVTVLVTVENCPYQIKTTSYFKIKDEDYTASMDWTDLRADQNGQYTGTGNVSWFAHWLVVPPGLVKGLTCTSTLTAAPTKANITGKINDSGQLVVDIAYDPVKAPSWRVVCSGTGGSTPPIDRNQFKLAPAPLTIIVPASTGGSRQLPQDLIDTLHGKALSFELVPLKNH